MTDRKANRKDITVIEIAANEKSGGTGRSAHGQHGTAGRSPGKSACAPADSIKKALKAHLPERHQKTAFTEL